MSIRIFAYGLRFFKGPWNLFDFIIIGIAIIPATGPASILRALRILRILRLISVVPSLRSVIGGLIAALPGMGSIVLLMALVFSTITPASVSLWALGGASLRVVLSTGRWARWLNLLMALMILATALMILFDV